MILARVMGTVVATRKDERLLGKKLLVCRPVNPEGEAEGAYFVAVDTVDSRSDAFRQSHHAALSRRLARSRNRGHAPIRLLVVSLVTPTARSSRPCGSQ